MPKFYKGSPADGGASLVPFLAIGAGLLLYKPITNLVTGVTDVTGAAGSVFSGIGKAVTTVTNGLGLTKSNAQSVKEDYQSSQGNPWDLNFYKGNRPLGTILCTKATADAICEALLSESHAFGYYMDLDRVLPQFRKLHSQASVSFVCDVWYQKQKTDFLEFLDDGGWFGHGLSDDGLKTILDYVSKLPKFK